MGQAHSGVELLYKSSVQTAGFSNLLLNHVIAEAFDLKVVAYTLVHRHDCFSN